MLEGNIASLLGSLLSKVFEEKCLTKDNIQSDIYHGHIKYTNLEAKKSFLNSLSVPIGLVRGVIGSLEVKLSASSIFRNEPLKLIAEDICLIVEPIDDYSIEDSIKNYYNAKLSEITVAEVRRQLQKTLMAKEEGGEDDGSYLKMLLRNIVKNLEVTLRGIHIRYEDNLPNSPFFAFGAVVDSFVFNTMTDPCLDDSKSYKQFTMRNAKFYFNNRTHRNWDDYSLREMIDLLHLPDEGNMNLVNIPDIIICIASIKKNYDLHSPDQSIYIQIPHIEMSLSHTQYLCMMEVSDFLTRTGNRDNYSLVRKSILQEYNTDCISDKPKLLWQYGIRSVIRNIRRLKCSYHRTHLHDLWSTGNRYLELYTIKQGEERELTEGEKQEVVECENVLPTPTILVWRALAEARLAQVKKPLTLRERLWSLFPLGDTTPEEKSEQDNQYNNTNLPSPYPTLNISID